MKFELVQNHGKKNYTALQVQKKVQIIENLTNKRLIKYYAKKISEITKGNNNGRLLH
jgi:hypothetical protein